MTWNTDISQAPRGRMETRQVETKDGTYSKEVFVPEKLILACRDGKTVTVSYWLAKSKRWCMLAKDEEPVAWMAYPQHPGVAP